MSFTLIHNNNCSKSRACILLLKQNKVKFNIREYLKVPLSLEEINDIVKNINGSKYDLLRGSEYTSSENELVSIIFNNQKVLQRPIFFDGKEYIICRPPEKVLDYI